MLRADDTYMSTTQGKAVSFGEHMRIKFIDSHYNEIELQVNCTFSAITEICRKNNGHSLENVQLNC